MRSCLNIEEIKDEIDRLKNDPDVKLAQKELEACEKGLRILNELRDLATRGKILRRSGYTIDDFSDITDNFDCY